MRKAQPYLAALMALAVSAPPTFAQQNRGTERDRAWYSRVTDRYLARDVAPINLTNSGRIESLLRAGRLYLSLQDAVALALENNLDIELQRYGPQLAQADLLRAQAGGVIRGIPTNISQGPSSAASLSQGGGAGTGVAGAGGSAGGGGSNGASNATVVFTGTQVPSLDEVAFLNYNWGHRTSVQSNTVTTGTASLVFESAVWSSGIQKEFLTGTSLQLGYTQNAQSSNSRRAEINPVNTGNVNVQFTQQLLRGFGVALNSRFIRIAKNDVKISDLVFKQQVIAAVATVVNLYSDLVSFNEDVKVRRQALSLAEKLYNDNRKQVEIGTLAPIEIVRAEAEVARSQQELTQAETQVLQQETILKNYLSRTGVASPSIADARIIPTDPLRIPDVEPVEPIQDLVARALANRPELQQTGLAIENARISLAGSKSQLLPSLSLIGSAQNSGLAGQGNALYVPASPTSPLNPLANIEPRLVGGLGGVWDQILGRSFPDYSLGFQLSIPLRNRAAQADITRDQLSLRQSELRQRQELNQIRVDVQNAVIGLQQSRARYQSAQKARVLQEQTLDAEQKKYALGASTIFFVIQAQRDLALAQATEVAALSSYNRARVSLDRATGQILNAFDVNIEEAMAGKVTRAPAALPVDIN
ncbi:MAG TPA: TolC family protein [Bryobacteraceae bacterium]|nr:TolC family protein [Bryobacteraceae bacterium]